MLSSRNENYNKKKKVYNKVIDHSQSVKDERNLFRDVKILIMKVCKKQEWSNKTKVIDACREVYGKKPNKVSRTKIHSLIEELVAEKILEKKSYLLDMRSFLIKIDPFFEIKSYKKL